MERPWSGWSRSPSSSTRADLRSVHLSQTEQSASLRLAARHLPKPRKPRERTCLQGAEPRLARSAGIRPTASQRITAPAGLRFGCHPVGICFSTTNHPSL